ncbi:hypothetical protein [Stenotrophomonas sp. LM091]|jgi:hypothetical protein|uniref:hypothetical protein n=1 Tax=Stenotrophomonas sp. LM091 TaxID=1904944 RepID=UPI0012E9AD20|nr:hypothetical protein [Stenotrophomonas sp. LM091]
MSTTEELTAAVFQEALADGHSSVPTVVLASLRSCSSWSGEEEDENLRALPDEIIRELEGSVGYPTGIPSAEVIAHMNRDAWVANVRGVLMLLDSWRDSTDHPYRKLRILLSLLHVLALNYKCLRAVAPDIKSFFAPETLAFLIKSVDVPVWAACPTDDATRVHVREISYTQNLNEISFFSSNLMPSFEMDVAAAYVLLYEISPEDCGTAVSQVRNMLSDLLAIHVLEMDALRLALKTDSPVFRYLAMVNHCRIRNKDQSGEESVAAIETILLDASNSEKWDSWLSALKFPTHLKDIDSAIPRALARMSHSALRKFVESLRLMHSGSTAPSMANILFDFSLRAQSSTSIYLWRQSFDVWNSWDYGSGDPRTFHASVPETVLDFAVATHYSALDSATRDAEMSSLIHQIDDVESAWHRSGMDVITRWNILRARLRLIQHGEDIASGFPRLLPSPPLPLDGYSAVRYRA